MLCGFTDDEDAVDNDKEDKVGAELDLENHACQNKRMLDAGFKP